MKCLLVIPVPVGKDSETVMLQRANDSTAACASSNRDLITHRFGA